MQKFLLSIQTTRLRDNVAHATTADHSATEKFKCQRSKNTLRSIQIKKIRNIFHQITCKSSYAVCLLECIICEIQYVGKFEAQLNRLNNHRKNIKNPNVIEACKHFNSDKNTYSKHGKLILTEQLRNLKTTPTKTLLLSVLDLS